MNADHLFPAADHRDDVGEDLPAPSDPMKVARELLRDHETDGCLTLRSLWTARKATPMPPSPLCKVCQGRLDAVLWSVGRHPNCRTSGPLDADAFDRLTRYLADVLGAETTEKPHETPQPKETP